ncbi:CHASE2 domain-containing protein [Iodobacter fluviatilis]|uniref:Adenylate cyclase n=1 Tax=Iodobacter fluviatilis TaxID=537 RepID=A0A377SYB7_9NEIS|nr:adenylate/guanylate cyclase domain-containing protein [Iodobacter fluviatilis]TCU87998.1 adenylate cyclase [Iodobacter fluviatilis]STR45499.1 Adenylate cyclase 2 [Iodobacter fluviatilis]
MINLKSIWQKLHLIWLGRVLFFVLSTLLVIWVAMPRGHAYPFPFDLLDRLHDQLIKQRLIADPEKRIVLVDIDEASLAQYGRWPWSRLQMAQLLQQLNQHYKVAHIGLDMIFPESSDLSGDQQIAQLAASGQLTLAQTFGFDRSQSMQVGQLSAAISWADIPATQAFGFLANHPKLAAQAPCVGHIAITADPDGVVRHQSMLVKYQAKLYPAFAPVLLRCWLGQQGPLQASKGKIEWLEGLSGQQIVAEDGMAAIPFLRRTEAYIAIPASDILAAKADVALLHNRLVIVGSSALGLGDYVATILGGRTPGMLLHAQWLSKALDQLEQNKPMVAIGFAAIMAVWAVLLLGVVLLHRRNNALRLAWGFFVLMAWLLWLGNTRQEVGANTLAPLLGGVVLLILEGGLEWWYAQLGRRQLYLAFHQYVPPAIIDQLIGNNSQAIMLPHRAEITCLFADLQGYTGIAERLPPEELAQYTRHALMLLTQAVLDQQGTLDKYMGDALFAFWGAPVEQDDHANRALNAAMAMQQAVDAYNQSAALDKQIKVHIGIQTGLVVVGDMGTPFRSTYTAIGDAVNVSARLQNLASLHNEKILVGEDTERQLLYSPLQLYGTVSLKGRRGVQQVYRLP